MPRPVITSPQRKRRKDMNKMYVGRVAASQLHFHSIIGDPHFNTALGGDAAELRRDLAFVAIDNVRAAMGDDCARHALFLTPRQLGANRRVTDECFAASANERAHNGSAIANVKLDAVQCSLPLVDEDEVWRVENPSAPSPHSISDRRGENGMFDRERFECYSTNLRRRTVLDQTPIFDGIML